MIPRFGEPCRKDVQYQLRPGAYAILPRNGQLLLTAQWDGGADYQLPGGGIDAGEHVLAALHREVLEETGWRIARPRRLGAFRRFVFMPEYGFWAEKLCQIYMAFPTRQIAMPTEPDHTAEWISPQRAVDILGNAGDRHFLNHFLQTFRPL